MTDMNYGGNLAQSILSTLERDPAFRNVAYFSMEIGLAPEIPTYSGGLGILAGDILKSAADLAFRWWGSPSSKKDILRRR